MNEQLPIDFSSRKAPLLTDEERRVWRIIETRRGKEAALLGPVIADLAGSDYDTVRAIISHLVTAHGCLIASCPRGFFVPVTPQEIEAATRSLRHRAIRILMRASRLQKSSLEDIFKQTVLELQERSINVSEQK